MARKVIVFGSLNMDLTIECDRMPQAGETISGRGFFLNPGGKGANQAVAAAKMGAPTYMVGAVGRDAFGEQMVLSLVEAGVSCECVERCADKPTGVASITRCAHDNRIILDAGANHALTAADVAAALDKLAVSGDVFLAQLECDIEATYAALKDAHERGMYTALNPAPARPLPEDVWPYIDLICVNETECEVLTGILPEDDASVRAALAAFAEKGVDTAVVTLGGRGSALQHGGEVYYSEPPLHNAVDTTCAGDTYIGALLAAHAADMPVREGLLWASCASALATTKLGAQQSIPSLEEVAALAERVG